MKNLKTIFGMLMLAMTFSVVITACGDDKDNKTTDNCKPLHDQISALAADSTTQVQAIRNAITPAMAEPEWCRPNYNSALNLQNPQSINDTARFNIIWIDDLKNEGFDDVAKKNLYNASELFLNTYEQLEAKRAELTTCK